MNENSNAMEDRPDIIYGLGYSETDKGVGRIHYSNCYLPEAITKVKTIIELLEFNYPSFDQVDVKIVFRNFIDEGALKEGIYKKHEDWKPEATFFSNSNNRLYPFFCVFLDDSPAKVVKIQNIDIYAKITDVTLLNEDGLSVPFEKLVNKIVYLPDSYYKLLDPPKLENQKYRIFAGHNYLIYMPLDEKKYSLSFRIQNYYPMYINGKVTSIMPMIFFSNHVEIKKYVVNYSGRKEISAVLFKHTSLNEPINPNVPIIAGFQGNIIAGELLKNLRPDDLKYDGTLLLRNRHLLTPAQKISIGAKVIDCPVPLSIYDLLKKNKNILVPPIMEYFVLNSGPAETELTLKTEILELSQPDIQKIRVAPGEIKRVTSLPTFIYDKAENLKISKEFTVYCSFSNPTGTVAEERTFKIRVLPYDTMLWRMLDESTGLYQWYFEYIVNWVRPHIKSEKADEVMRSSLERVALKKFGGYNDMLFKKAQSMGLFKTKKEYVRHIVKSLYDSVSDLNPRYSNETVDFGRSKSQFGQKIRYPKETLEQGRGNCIDAAVMFGSLLEQISLYPVIVFVPGHAFVGWETWENSNEYEFLETTKLGYESFETAYKIGIEEEQKHFGGNPFGSPEVKKVYVKKMREIGVYSRDLSGTK
jgi:hypothetical protein